MRSATHVESFSLQGVGVVTDTLIPNIGGMAIKTQGPDLHSSEVALICRLVLESAEPQCGEAVLCEFVPQYALRFHNADAESSLDLLIELRCPTLGFRRGRETVAGLPSNSGNAYCISDSLSFLVHGLFQDKAGFRRMSANWLMQPTAPQHGALKLLFLSLVPNLWGFGSAIAAGVVDTSRYPCVAELPEPDFEPSEEALAYRQRILAIAPRSEIYLNWRTPDEQWAWNREMPDWMKKISNEILDRILLLQRKGVLQTGQRHLAVEYSSETIPVDSLARLKVQCRVSERSLFDDAFFRSIGGCLEGLTSDPSVPGSDYGWLVASVPPEFIRCLAERPQMCKMLPLSVFGE